MSAVRRAVRWAPTLVALLAAACSTAPKTPPGPVAPEPSGPQPYVPAPTPDRPRSAPSDALSPAALPGWNDEDHLGAFRAYVDGCGAARDAAGRAACARARAMAGPALTPSDARAFFEAGFSAAPVRTPEGTPGLLTSYFAPEYPARRKADA